MVTYRNGALWTTLEMETRGVELVRNGWGSSNALSALPLNEIPGVWLCNDHASGCQASIQRAFLAKGTPQVVSQDGRVVGMKYEDAYATYVLLMGVLPSDKTAPRTEQAMTAFENVERALQSVGFEFKDVVRTWLYLDQLLDWYDDFNRVRDAFFEKKEIFGGFVPASTGIGSANMNGSAIIMGAIAMQPKDDRVKRIMVDSPLQCSALDYRSTFSRAAEIITPRHSTLFISGTASIEPGGETAYLNDPERQIGLTMDVVEAILKSRDMTFQNNARAVAYIKRPEYRPYWRAWLASKGLPVDFAQEVVADVCRDNLLFELEMDAIKRR